MCIYIPRYDRVLYSVYIYVYIYVLELYSVCIYIYRERERPYVDLFFLFVYSCVWLEQEKPMKLFEETS